MRRAPMKRALNRSRLLTPLTCMCATCFNDLDANAMWNLVGCFGYGCWATNVAIC